MTCESLATLIIVGNKEFPRVIQHRLNLEVEELNMITVQRVISSLASFLLLMIFATLVAAGKPDKPDKPGGGGKPPAEREEPLEVVYVDPGVEMVIDGYMNEWAEFGCNLFPQYWAGKVWKNKMNDGILAESCVVSWKGRVYVAGWATPGNAINDKEISTHVKFNGFEMVSNVDRVLDGFQPEFAYSGIDVNAEGWPIAMAYEPSFDYPFTSGEEVEVIIHVSSCPELDCNDGAGQSARTLKSFFGVVFPSW
jgi:hypothetical protein